MRLELESPADRELGGRSELLSGWVGAPHGSVTLSAHCGGRPIVLRRFRHPATYAGARLQGFWGYLVVQELLDELRDGHLVVRFRADDREIAAVPLRISSLAVTMAREYPLDLRRYSVTAVSPIARTPPPQTVVFPGLGGVGGASLNDVMRRNMVHEGWDATVYHEGNDPVLWRRIVRDGGRAPRWIDGHACFGAGQGLAGQSSRVTLLREPRARLLSVFNYNKLVHPDEFRFATFDDFVLTGAARTYGQAFGLLRAAGRPVDPSISADDLYAQTRRTLDEDYDFVGITELFEEVVFLLAALAGYTTIGMWWRVLAAPRSLTWEGVAPYVRQMVEHQLGPEIRAYNEQRDIFAHLIAGRALGHGFACYKSAAATGPALPDQYKLAECRRWRQLLRKQAENTRDDTAQRGAA